MKIIQDLGEDAFPEPAAATATTEKPVDAEVSTVEKVDPPPSQVGAPETATPKVEVEEKERKVTTAQREPMKVPDTVHVNITRDNLKDYVGPPVYYKDRMYDKAPPHGVSTGLGYLGNGSGAVMPIEATVSHHDPYCVYDMLTMIPVDHAGQGLAAIDGQAR